MMMKTREKMMVNYHFGAKSGSTFILAIKITIMKKLRFFFIQNVFHFVECSFASKNCIQFSGEKKYVFYT